MKFEYSPVVRLRDEDGSYKICEPLCKGFQWVGAVLEPGGGDHGARSFPVGKAGEK